jgi:hypothetical protein
MNRMKYFDLTDNMLLQERWHLRSPVDEPGREVDPWQFKKGLLLDITDTIIFPVEPTGVALDFTLASFLIPVVHRRIVELFKSLGIDREVQFIPARVEGFIEDYFILNVMQVIRCIDDARCEEVLYWLPEDERPDKVGQYRDVVGMKIDPEQVGGANIFRPWGWRVALIVSERVKLAMESEGITGPKFTEV